MKHPDEKIKKLVEEDHVNIPEFQLKKRKMDFFIDYLASPVINPIEDVADHSSTILLIHFTPIIMTFIGVVVYFLV
jgi:hypothetical protein